MVSPVYIIRNYLPVDFPSYCRLILEAERAAPMGRIFSPELLKKKLHFPGHSPEKDLFLAEVEGQIVGYMDVLAEVRIGRLILDCFIHPDHRRRGLAARLLCHALRRGKELGVPLAYVNIPEGNEVAREVLPRLGFRFIRRFLGMELNISKIHLADVRQNGLEQRSLRRGEEDKLTQIQNRSFAGSWGFQPNTVAETIYQMRLSRNSPDDIILACDGDRVIGYCWTRTNPADTHGRRGQILMFGVDPDYRARGTGRRLLLAGLAHLKRQGHEVAELTVDSENKAACALYQSLGFKVKKGSLWYEKGIS